ncbi:hemagglutinin repeat-containing protein [Burkholderia lata]|uniref:Large exoprotein involved in heme utilization or adhesion n=1 Tax=Burkholderia lata (strain ATCC 17760 / DSM 23089 / LMG 22485 / NCIMB 9086 / R18194 / 383) TaxID=482957 RepID=A0A6P2R223_BURL3|nr:hemagglutinin repeat-containing protein [Burkholderia lata]VWC28774.1 Large exoprotein involved in heme utilization or adhesion [Burkholderia lata]
MNKNNYRLVFSRVRGMLVAVEETASTSGKACRGEARVVAHVPHTRARFALRHAAFAVLVAAGATPIWANAQIVGGGANAPSVIQTQNGLPQVNINKPGSSGVSLNTYNQFDVQKPGAILNNSPTIVNTQQAGYINGNPNFGPNDAARIIVNQVNSPNASQIRGAIEIAGQKAELVIANPSGIFLDGAGFVNTSRAVLTTGVPYYGSDGSLAGFNVNRGLVTVAGSGLNASNIDQVDIISRAIQTNAAIYAKNLNVIAGANQVNHDTLAARPIQGDGAAPAVAIDVGQLGGMYSNRIFLVSSGSAVGVQNAGTLSADAAGMTLTTDGRLMQSGKISSLGNVAVTAAGGVQNSGTTYSQQSVSVSTGADVTNTGMLAAQQNVGINAGSLNSTGGIGAGVDSNGAVTQPGNLQITTTGQLNATGQNLAGGNATLTGGGVNLAGSQTAANGSLALNANAGDLNLSRATTSAQGPLNASASGALINDHGNLSSQSSATLTAGSVSNQGGTVSSQGPLTVRTIGALSNQAGTLVSQNTADVEGGAIDNQQGILQSAGQMKVAGASLQNAAGRVTSLNSDGLSVTTSGQLTNAAGTTVNGAQGGVIGGDGNVSVQAGSLANHGSISAATDLTVVAQSVDNGSGSLTAGQNASIDAGAYLANASGSVAAGAQANVRAANLDNSSGAIQASQLSLTATDLENRSGSIMQTGTNPTTVTVSGTLDNSSGTVQTNSTDLSLTPAALINDHGSIAHAGSGTLTIGTGALSNQGGSIATNGALALTAAALSNQAGTLSAQRQATLGVQSLDNSAGGYIGADSITLKSHGAINNRAGTVEANHGVTVAADSLANDGGAIKALGTDALSVTTTNALTNTAGGTIGGNGDVSIQAGSADNSNGSLLAAQSLSVQSNGSFTNAAGLVQSNGNLKVAALGAVSNVGGEIEANGTTATLQLSGSTIDNSDGRIVNIGTGATTIDGGASITNTNASGKAGAGTIGGNGDVSLTTQALTNAQGGQTLAGHALALIVASSVNNGNGVLSAANKLTLTGANAALSNQGGSVHANGVLSLQTASIDNTSGKIGNDAGSGGSIAIQTGTLSNSGGAIGSDQDLSLTAGTLTGDGSIVAGRNGSVSLTGDYTQTAANKLHANGDLNFTTSGKLTNQGVMDANGALTVSAANVENQSGADLNSASTTVNANGGTIDNAGRIEGDTVTTHSATLNNTGTVIGNNVTANAATINNTRAAAVFAAANQLNLYASNQLSNTGGANLYSVGDINIAANSQRDANGWLANRTQNVLNDQSTIEAQGNIELAAGTFTNTRPAPTVTTETTGTTTTHETKRQKYIVCATMNADPNGGCSQAMWVNGYKTPLTSSYSPSQVVSESSGPNATDKVLVVNVNGKQQTIYYNTLTTNADGSVTVNYWDAYDPHVNYVPDTEYTTRSDGHNGYQRVEIWRDTTSTTQQDKVTSQAQQAQLVAGGSITMANVGTINNDYSAIAAGKSIQIGSTQQNGAVGSGSYGGTVVNNVGRTLYQYQTDNIVSMYAWNEDTTQDRGTIVEPPVVHTPVAIGGTGGTIIANQSVSIDAQSVNNQNVAAQNSATGATGGTLGNNSANQGVSGGNLTKVSTASGSTTVPALQSVASATGALSITLPTSGMYSIHSAPGQPYLVVTDPRLTSYTNFISSDYMLGQLNLNPASIEKRLGDGMYEQQMVRNQITQLTGRTFLPGYASAEDEYRALMTNGANYAKEFGLVPGMALTAAQMDALTSDIVWLVDQAVTLPDGSTTHVLAPVVYMAQTHANDLQPTGGLIAADDVEIHTIGSTTNSGVIKGGTKTVISATDILNRGGTISSSGTNGTTVVSASNDVVNASGMITGNRVAVSAGRDIVNTTLVDAVGATGASGASQVNTSLIGQQGTIAATGDLSAQAGRDLTLHGANLSAGGNALVTAGRDINVDTVQSTTNQSMYLNDQHHWEESKTTNVTSGVTAGGSLGMQSGNDTTLKGATVTAGKDLSAIAGGNLTATTVTDEHRLDNVAVDGRARKEVDHTYDQTAVGTTFSAGQNATLAAINTTDASKGNVTLTGSSVTSGTNSATPGGLAIAGSGNVTINEAREEHDSYQNVQTKRGSFVSGSTTKESHDTRANIGVASTVSGDTVNVQSGKDLTIQGSNVVGTNDVNLKALGDVKITTSQNTVQSANSFEKKDSGLMSNGGMSVTIGTRSMTDQQHSTEVTNTGSMVGSVNGNLNVTAGNDLHATGSTLHAGNDMSLGGKSVTIDSAHDTMSQAEQQQYRQAGVSVGITSPVIALAQTGRQMVEAAGKTKGDARLTALAAATTGLAAKNAYDATGGGDPSALGKTVGVNISVGASKSDNQSQSQASTAVGSTVSAGRNVTINATGAGADSNIDVIGSTISAGGNAKLAADGKVNLQAAENSSSQSSTNSGGSFGVGVSIGAGKQNGIAFTAGVAGNRGNSDGNSTSWTNTHVTAGDTLTIQSGGDTNLKGAVASGKQIVANVGGNLNVESSQDTDHYNSKQQGAGVSVSVCVPPLCAGPSSVSGNISQQKMNSDYASVIEQSGIKAGDGGYQVDVKGNTDLKGGVIASSEKAVQDGVNSLTTATLTTSDIQNHASYDASSVGISGGYGGGIGKNQKGTADNVNPVGGTELPKTQSGLAVAPPVVLSASDDASSTTRSGISGGSLKITDNAKQQELTGKTADETVASVNRDTSNTGGALAPLFDKDKIQAGFDITSQFINQAGTFVDNRLKEADAAQAAAKNQALTPEQRLEAQQKADQLTAEWGPDGSYRQVLSALTAAAGGNVTGGMGQFAQTGMINYLQQQGASYIGDLVKNGMITEGSPLHAAMHAIVACAGAAASSQSCGAGALGAATASLLTNLFAPPGPDMTELEKEAKQNLISSIVAGVATASGVGGSSGAVAATNSATATTQNNWLASEQRVQAQKEWDACKGNTVCQLQTAGKWTAISGKQDLLTANGFIKGVSEGLGRDVVGMAQFMMHPVDGINALSALISRPEIRAQLGEQLYASLNTQIAEINTALTVGGDANAELLGKNIGGLVYQVGSVATGVYGAAKASIALGSAGIDLTSQALLKFADKAGEFGTLTNLKSLFGANGQPLMDFSKLTSAQKGTVGEVLGGATVDRLAPGAERVGRIPAVGEQGIDDLYKVNKPGVDYVIVEYKYDTSKLKKTADGLQMSDDWLTGANTGFNRMRDAVSNDRVLSADIQNALNSNRVEKWLVHTDPYGNVTVGILDKNGKFVIQPDSKIIGH